MASLPPKQSCCTTKVLHTGTPTGKLHTLAGLPCYTTSNYSKDATKFLFIFSDVYGLDLVNTKLVADTFADKLGYPAVIMDILNNDPIRGANPDFGAWIARHPVDMTTKIIRDFFDEFLKEHTVEFSSGIGYCFGAKYLAHYLTKDGLINVGAFAHPSFVSEEELAAIAKPLVISCAEVDQIFPDELRTKSKQILEKSKIHYQIDLYSGTAHGFSVRGDLNDPIVKYAAEKAIIDQAHWFKFHEK